MVVFSKTLENLIVMRQSIWQVFKKIVAKNTEVNLILLIFYDIL